MWERKGGWGREGWMKAYHICKLLVTVAPSKAERWPKARRKEEALKRVSKYGGTGRLSLWLAYRQGVC